MRDKRHLVFIFRTVLVYAVLALLVVQVVKFGLSYFDYPKMAGELISSLAYLHGPFVLYFSWAVSTLPPPDRRIMVIALIWSVGPIFFGIFGWLLLVLTGESWSRSVDLSLFALIILVTFIWSLISSPFARTWAASQFQQSSSLDEVLRKLAWPFKPKEVIDAEPSISPKLYYTFIAAIAAIIFISFEAMIGEFFDNNFELPGYFGATVLGIAIAGGMFPIHKRASGYFVLENLKSDEAAADDAKSAAIEIAKSIARIVRLLARHWYVVIAYLLTIHNVIKWVFRLT